MKRLLVLTIIFSLILFSSLFSQNYAGKIGLVFSTNPSVSMSNVGVSYWLNNNVSLEPVFGFSNTSVQSSSSMMMAPGARVIYHMGPNKMKPYVGGGFTAFMASSTGSDTYTDMMISGIYGVELFLNKWISLGGEFRVDFVITNKDSSPLGYMPESTVIKTASTIILRFYIR